MMHTRKLNRFCRKEQCSHILSVRGIAIILAVLASCFAKEGQSQEDTVFAFKTSKGKIATLSIGQVDSTEYLVYRFGNDSAIELEYPTEQKGSFAKFFYTWYFRGGGAQNEGLDLNSVSFRNGNYSYEIYQEYAASDSSNNVGIRIGNEDTGKKFEIKALPETVKGSLVDLRFDDRIPK